MKDTDGTWSNKKDKSNGQDSGVVKSQPGSVPDSSRGPYIQRINDDAREDEMEDNMQAVGSILGNLKNMATDMGNEISKQNKQLDRLTTKVLFCFLIFCSTNFDHRFIGRERGRPDRTREQEDWEIT